MTLIFIVLLFSNAWRGCKVGPIRCLAPFAAFCVAGTLAWFFGSKIGFEVFSGTTIPWILRGLLGILLTGTIVWLLVFAVFWRWGRKQVNKETGENEHPLLGAVVGCWIGIFILAAIVLVIDTAGTLGATLLSSRRHSDSIVANIARGAVYTQESLGKIPGFSKIAAWDPLPENTKHTLEKLVVIAGDPQKMRRFLHADEVQSVLTLPSVYPLFNSPEIQSMICSGDIDGLLTNPKVTGILDDEDFQKAIESVDYKKLIDELSAD